MSLFEPKHSPAVALEFNEPGHPKPGACADIPLFTRYSGNPILSRENWPYPINSVFNAGAVQLSGRELCCFAESKIAAAYRICVRRARRMESMDGASIPNQR